MSAGRRTPGAALRDFLSADNALLVTALAIFVALVVGGLCVALSDTAVLDQWGESPLDGLGATWDAGWGALVALFKGAIVDPAAVGAAFDGSGDWSTVFYPISETLVSAAPLVLAGLAVVVPFRAGLFNIGAQGQMVGGAIGAGYVGFAVSLPPVLHIVAAFLAAFAGGALVGALAGWLRARTGAHEVITTIMLNYVLVYLLAYLLSTNAFQRPDSNEPLSPVVDGNAMLPHLGGGLRLHLGVAIAVAVAAAVAWFLRRTTTGFAFRTVGANPDAARTAGIGVGRVFVLSMLIGGGLAGFAGANETLGTQYALTAGIAGTFGFDAITVALLGRGRAWGAVWAALLFGALHAGGVQLQATTSAPVDIVIVIQALIVVFVAAPQLLAELFRLRARRARPAGPALPTLDASPTEVSQ